MSYTLVLVGGTGQRFGLGLGYLNLLGVAKMPDRVVIVDAEGTRGPNPVTAMAEKLLRFGRTPDLLRFKRIPPYPKEGVALDRLTVSQCVDHEGSDLFSLCYSDDEQRLSISQGFYAVPKLAALVFRALLNSKNDSFDDEFRAGAAAANVGRNVFVVGSVAGGTGAGIMRGLADAYRRAKCRVFGIVFSRFFDIAKGEPTSKDLDRNARVGCDYLLRGDLDSPFEALVMVGPADEKTLPEPVGPEKGLPHSFSGLLNALSLVTDGGHDLARRCTDHQEKHPRPDGARVRLDFAFGARGQGEPLQDTDIWFPAEDVRGTHNGYISLVDARDAAREAQVKLEAWQDFPFQEACGRSSLFVERKLGARVTNTLRALSDPGHIDGRQAKQLWEQLADQGGAIAAACDGLKGFGEWIGNIAETDTMCATKAPSSALTPKTWRAALDQAPRTEPTELTALAQSWCIHVARAQWRAGQRKLEGPGGRWLFPYATAPNNSKAGELTPLMTGIEVNEVDSRSYPTPLGQAHAFAKRIELKHDQKQALHDAEILWFALSVGWLQIDICDLGTSPSVFEQLVAQGDPHSRFTGILRIRSGNDVPVKALAGKVVGATHPSCGLWPGLRDDARSLLKALNEALAPKHRGIARRVLRRWKESLSSSGTQAPSAAWWTVVRMLTLESNGAGDDMIELEHVRTRGPVLLDTRTASQDPERVVPLYVFTYEPNRAAKCSRILGALADGARVADNRIVLQDDEIARIQLRRTTDAGQRIDLDAMACTGYLDLDVHPVDLRRLKDGGEQPRDTLIHKLQVPEGLLARWDKDAGGDTSPRRPDLTWRRDARKIIDEEVIFEIAPIDPTTHGNGLRLHQVDPSYPEVPGIAFHPDRGKWVVWLQHPSSNPSGACVRVAGSTVRVEQGGRSWLLRFPEDSLIMAPQDIYSTEIYKLKPETGSEVLPALPVESEYLDLVMCGDKPEDKPRPARPTSDGLWFEFRLFGDLDVTWSVEASKITTEDKLHIELWPDLPSPWRRFWFAIESDVASTAYEYTVHGRSPHGYYQRLGPGGAGDHGSVNRYFSVTGRPRLLWMGTPGKGTPPRHRGAGFIAFPDKGAALASPNSATDTATIALDFGTFRTALLVASDPDHLDWPPSSKAMLPGCRRTLVDNAGKAQAQRKNRSVFPPTTGPAPGPAGSSTIATVLGSTVVFSGTTIPGSHSIPFQDFSIPWVAMDLTEYPSTDDPELAEGSAERRARARFEHGGLKWDPRPRVVEVRTGYLKAILLLGAVEAFRRGATKLDLRYSFPLAYPRPEVLKASFRAAKQWLETEVFEGGNNRVELTLREPDSESNAGMKAAEADSPWTVTLDLGGGTLDLGVYQHNNTRIAWDSVRLGANLVTAAHKNKGNDIRWQIIRGEVDYTEASLVRYTDKLLRLAMEYAARTVAGALLNHENVPQGATITAVLLGSGWRWDRCRGTRDTAKFDVQGFEGFYGKLLEGQIQALAPGVVSKVSINAKLLHGDQEKLAVAYGLACTKPEDLNTRDCVKAPNGLAESGRPWTAMVHHEQLFGPPTAIAAQPAFPEKLESIAAFKGAFERTEVSQTILSRLRGDTDSTHGTRTRTALGFAYEYLIPEWFKP